MQQHRYYFQISVGSNPSILALTNSLHLQDENVKLHIIRTQIEKQYTLLELDLSTLIASITWSMLALTNSLHPQDEYVKLRIIRTQIEKQYTPLELEHTHC